MNNTKETKVLISVIIPFMNEVGNIHALYQRLRETFYELKDYTYEFIFVDDGSSDDSITAVQLVEAADPERIRLIRLARNFGKEIAITAGLHYAKGEAAIMIDADLQHPPEVIPEFLKKWREGYDVVVGRRYTPKAKASFVKRTTSRWFYRLMGAISAVEITPNATDFRLLDRSVLEEFNRFTERNRLTRGLIDWLGFSRTYVDFEVSQRFSGKATYSYKALVRLAINSIISMSFVPLKLAGYLGVLIIFTSGPFGIFIFVERYILHDPLHLHFSGPAILATMLVFLVGIVLVCLGLMALYIANIYGEVVNRPLYVEKRRPLKAPELHEIPELLATSTFTKAYRERQIPVQQQYAASTTNRRNII